MSKITIAILLAVALTSCGGNSSTATTQTTQTPPPTTTPPPTQDTWLVAELLIFAFMDSADKDLQSKFTTKYTATVNLLASQGMLNSGNAVIAIHADAEAEINQFISDLHDFVWTVAISNRIDEIGMTALMNDFKSRQLTYFNTYPYAFSTFFVNLLLPMISDTLDTAYSTELLIMAQLW